MGLGQGKKRPLPGGETSESKRGFSRRGLSFAESAAMSADVCGNVSTEQISAQFSPPSHGCDEMPLWRDDSYSGVDSEACIIGDVLEGRYSSANEPSACTSVSEVFRSSTTADSAPQLGGLQSTGNRLVEFEQHGNWVRSVAYRKSATCVSKHDTLAKSPNGFLILHHGSIEETGNSHASRIRGQLSTLDGSAEGEQQGGHLAKSHYGSPTWNVKDGSFREGQAVHQKEFGWQVTERKASHRPTFALFLGKIVSAYSASFSADESSRFKVSVDQARVTDHRVGPHRNTPLEEDMSILLDGVQEPEPDSRRDLPSGELQNERRFISYVNSSGRLVLKEDAREPTIDHEFEERFSALLLS